MLASRSSIYRHRSSRRRSFRINGRVRNCSTSALNARGNVQPQPSICRSTGRTLSMNVARTEVHRCLASATIHRRTRTMARLYYESVKLALSYKRKSKNTSVISYERAKSINERANTERANNLLQKRKNSIRRAEAQKPCIETLASSCQPKVGKSRGIQPNQSMTEQIGKQGVECKVFEPSSTVLCEQFSEVSRFVTFNLDSRQRRHGDIRRSLLA